ncbi:uncharacterized protein LOC135818443 [Sycon ciliatum]|uniref:uncharacterized protein LOC135818443 n=1 Tax=Sycon ciliatum TaxID=27933 RepID=UPI0020AC8984|eukprot:scpid85997/ scgid27472/ 
MSNVNATSFPSSVDTQPYDSRRCGTVVCDPDYLHCCVKNGLKRCCANADRPSSSNNFKWATWIGGGFGIGLFLFICVFVIHRRSKAQFHKRRSGRRAYAPAAGMNGGDRPLCSTTTLSGSSSTDGCTDCEAALDGQSSAAPAATTTGMSSTIVFPDDGPPRVECRTGSQPAMPPPYSNDNTVTVTTNSNAILSGEHEQHFNSVESAIGHHGRRLPDYQEVNRTHNAPHPGRLVFMSQTSRDQLLPVGHGHENDEYDLDTLPTPTAEDPLEPPPAYTS